MLSRLEKTEAAEKELRELIEEKEAALSKSRDDLENLKIKCAAANDEVSQMAETLQGMEVKVASMSAGQVESERAFAEQLELIAGLKDDKRALSEKVEETLRSGEESLEKERGEARRLIGVLAKKELALENLALSNSDNGIALAAVANKKDELERELLELKEGTAALMENKLRIEEIDNQKSALEEELRRVKIEHTEAIANLESAALVAIELQDKLNKENENLEFNVKAQRSDLTFALEKVEELKKQLKAKDVEIEEAVGSK